MYLFFLFFFNIQMTRNHTFFFIVEANREQATNTNRVESVNIYNMIVFGPSFFITSIKKFKRHSCMRWFTQRLKYELNLYRIRVRRLNVSRNVTVKTVNILQRGERFRK